MPIFNITEKNGFKSRGIPRFVLVPYLGWACRSGLAGNVSAKIIAQIFSRKVNTGGLWGVSNSILDAKSSFWNRYPHRHSWQDLFGLAFHKKMLMQLKSKSKFWFWMKWTKVLSMAFSRGGSIRFFSEATFERPKISLCSATNGRRTLEEIIAALLKDPSKENR